MFFSNSSSKRSAFRAASRLFSLTLCLLISSSLAHAGFCKAGDANMDGVFDQDDLMLVFQENRFTRDPDNPLYATWEAGDWNNDNRFDSDDLILALSEKVVRCPLDASETRSRRPAFSSSTNGTLGTNLAQPKFWESTVYFKDRFKTARSFVANGKGCNNFQCTDVPLRSDGYPEYSPFDDGKTAKTTLGTGDGSGNFIGNYTLSFKGTGTVRVWGLSVGEQYDYRFTTAGEHSFFVLDDSKPLLLEIEESAKEDPVRDIQVILPGETVESVGRQPFLQETLEQLKDYKTIRFMDWGAINTNDIERWGQRPLKNSVPQTEDFGVAYEWMVALVNSLPGDPWICIPTRADDTYVRNLALLLRSQLRPEKKLYLEYSNEVWNDDFRQTEYAREQGARLGFQGATLEKFKAKRSAEIFDIFDRVFREHGAESANRIVRVLAHQGAKYVGALDLIDAFGLPRVDGVPVNLRAFDSENPIRAHAIAIAPYFGGTPIREIINNGTAKTHTVSQILDLIEADFKGKYVRKDGNVFYEPSRIETIINEYVNLATVTGLDLIAYEGGQHVAAHTNVSRNDERLTNLFQQVNRAPRLFDLYRDYFELWTNSGAGVFTHYLHTSSWNKFGSWGALEYHSQPWCDSPKYLALRHYLDRDRFCAAVEAEGCFGEVGLCAR